MKENGWYVLHQHDDRALLFVVDMILNGNVMYAYFRPVRLVAVVKRCVPMERSDTTVNGAMVCLSEGIDP